MILPAQKNLSAQFTRVGRRLTSKTHCNSQKTAPGRFGHTKPHTPNSASNYNTTWLCQYKISRAFIHYLLNNNNEARNLLQAKIDTNFVINKCGYLHQSQNSIWTQTVSHYNLIPCSHYTALNVRDSCGAVVNSVNSAFYRRQSSHQYTGRFDNSLSSYSYKLHHGWREL